MLLHLLLLHMLIFLLQLKLYGWPSKTRLLFNSISYFVYLVEGHTFLEGVLLNELVHYLILTLDRLFVADMGYVLIGQV